MDILFVTAGEINRASTRLRILNIIPHLENFGANCDTIGPPPNNPTRKAAFALKLLNKARKYDIIYIQRIPFPPWYLVLIDHVVRAVVYDFDDALYTTPTMVNNNNNGSSKRLNDNIRLATTVIAGSPTLSSYADRYSDDVQCLPTSIPREKYDNQEIDSGGKLVIGWIGNPENLVYLMEIIDPLKIILDEYSDVELHIITSGDLPVEPLRERSDVIYKQWSREREIELLSRADIGIRPLIDDEWTRAKGGFTSVVQCMALQIPVVVTPVGMIPDLVEHEETGFLAQNYQEWTKYISTLIDDERKRAIMGQKARESISEKRLWDDQYAADLYKILENNI